MNKILDNIHLFFHHLKNFLKNIGRFRKQLWNFQDFSYSYNVDLFARSIELTKDYIRKYGVHSEASKEKKVRQMTRMLYLIKSISNSKFIDIAIEELGYDFEFFPKNAEDRDLYVQRNKSICLIADEIRQSYLDEIEDILFNKSCEDGKNIMTWED